MRTSLRSCGVKVPTSWGARACSPWCAGLRVTFFAEELLDAGLADADAALPRHSPTCCIGDADRLDDGARRLVRAVACSDARHDYAVLTRAVGLAEEKLDEALRSAIDHKVLTRIGDEAYQFRHALLGEAIRDDLLPGERRRIHAAYLEALTTSDPRGPAAEIAHHALGAGQRETALFATIEAAEAAQRLAGYDEAAQHYEQALNLLDAAPGGFDTTVLVIDASAALVTSGRLLRAVELLRDHLAQLPADVPIESRGRLLVAIGNTTYYANLDTEAADASAEAARIVPDGRTVLRAEVAALHARTSSSRGRYDEAIQWGRALAIAEQIEAADVIADAKATLTRVMVRRGDDPEKAKQGFVELVASSRGRRRPRRAAACISSGFSPLTKVPSTPPTAFRRVMTRRGDWLGGVRMASTDASTPPSSATCEDGGTRCSSCAMSGRTHRARRCAAGRDRADGRRRAWPPRSARAHPRSSLTVAPRGVGVDP